MKNNGCIDITLLDQNHLSNIFGYNSDRTVLIQHYLNNIKQ